MTRALHFGCSALLLSCLLGCAPAEREAGARPNILLIVIDALRAGHLGCYGYERETSPTLDRIAASGVVFETAIAPSSTTIISMASLFTSLHPVQHGVRYSTVYRQTRWGPEEIHEKDPAQVQALNEQLTTLAEILSGQGYETLGVMTNPFLWESLGFSQGFRSYEEGEMDSDEVVDRFLDWLEESDDSPFLAYLHFMDVHSPYQPGRPYNTMCGPGKSGLSQKQIEEILKQSNESEDSPSDVIKRGKIRLDPEYFQTVVGLYDGCIRRVDDSLGRLFHHLETTGRLKDTVVAITADHGEEFMDHGRMGHGRLLYDNLIRVPLILSPPGGSAAGQRVMETVSLLDLMPTLLELGGVPVPDGLSGRSLVPFILPEMRETRESQPAFGEQSTRDARKESIRTDDFKLIRTFRFEPIEAETKLAEGGETALDGQLRLRKLRRIRIELYDLHADPDESNDISVDHPEVVDELLIRLDAHLAGLTPRVTLDNMWKEIDPEMEKRLKALGYLK
jgi:arylsulfatase A-like enzyme